jgi:hypothetical protein
MATARDHRTLAIEAKKLVTRFQTTRETTAKTLVSTRNHHHRGTRPLAHQMILVTAQVMTPITVQVMAQVTTPITAQVMAQVATPITAQVMAQVTTTITVRVTTTITAPVMGQVMAHHMSHNLARTTDPCALQGGYFSSGSRC